MVKSSSKKIYPVNLSKERIDLLSKLFVDDVTTIVAEGVHSWLRERGVMLAQLLMNAEVTELVGERYKHNTKRDCVRWGDQAGSAYILEQRVPLVKQRIRTKAVGSEVELQTYKLLNDKEFVNEQAMVKLLGGLSTRRQGESLEKMLRGRGVGRQTISQRGMEEMTKQLEEFETRSLEGLNILVVFMDGIHLADTVHVAAIGIDGEGKKHVLGFEEGSTESSGVCRALLSRLIERDIVSEEGGYLFVIDGGKGLKKAIDEVFGKRVHIQRCKLHKRRNVEEKLPKQLHEWFRQKFNAAYGKKTFKEADEAFVRLRQELILKRRHGAANSLLEGQQQLLTLHRIGIAGVLRKSLCTTNSIESIFSAARYYSRNIKRWRDEEQMKRWLASGLLEAEKKLKRVPGYTQLNKLKEILGKAKKAK